MTKEEKMNIVINNCYKVDVNDNLSIKEIYKAGFKRGFYKGQDQAQKIGYWRHEVDYHGDIVSNFSQNHYYCSLCGQEALIIPEIWITDLSKYCPNCGAIMETINEIRND